MRGKTFKKRTVARVIFPNNTKENPDCPSLPFLNIRRWESIISDSLTDNKVHRYRSLDPIPTGCQRWECSLARVSSLPWEQSRRIGDGCEVYSVWNRKRLAKWSKRLRQDYSRRVILALRCSLRQQERPADCSYWSLPLLLLRCSTTPMRTKKTTNFDFPLPMACRSLNEINRFFSLREVKKENLTEFRFRCVSSRLQRRLLLLLLEKLLLLQLLLFELLLLQLVDVRQF